MKIYIKKKYRVEMPRIISIGDWIDLYTYEDILIRGPHSNAGTEEIEVHSKLIDLGVAMQLPEGFEAVVLPRSSTFARHGVMLANSQGVIDWSYRGPNDYWKFGAVAMRTATIPANSRIAQFRIQLSQKATILQKLRWLFSNRIELVEVPDFEGDNRGGLGSTGI